MSLLSVNELNVHYMTPRGIVKAVGGVNLEIEEGDMFGIAGESGCGKSTTALSILRLLPLNARITQGRIFYKGEDLVKKSEKEMRKIRWKQISFVFQATMNAFNPVARIGEQIVEAIQCHENIDRESAWKRVAELFELTGLDAARIKEFPHEFSGGMKQRAMIAMALACNPELVIADEPVTALDVITQANILRLLRRLQRKTGLSLLIITHDLSIMAELCNKLAIMYAGKIVESGDTSLLFYEPTHPYTHALIDAFPDIQDAHIRLGSPLPGRPPDLLQPLAGCRFRPRCKFAKDICEKEEPRLERYKNRLVACHRVS